MLDMYTGIDDEDKDLSQKTKYNVKLKKIQK